MAEKAVTITRKSKPEEEALIKSVFSDGGELLRLMKNLFFGLELNEGEKQIIVNTFKNTELKRIIRERFLPTVDKETPAGQTIDLWTGIDLTGLSRDEIQQTIQVRQNMIDWTTKALKLLENPDGEKVDINYSLNPFKEDYLGINLTSRNRFIGHIEFQCVMLQAIADSKSETKEQEKKRLALDSVR